MSCMSMGSSPLCPGGTHTPTWPMGRAGTGQHGFTPALEMRHPGPGGASMMGGAAGRRSENIDSDPEHPCVLGPQSLPVMDTLS